MTVTVVLAPDPAVATVSALQPRPDRLQPQNTLKFEKGATPLVGWNARSSHPLHLTVMQNLETRSGDMDLTCSSAHLGSFTPVACDLHIDKALPYVIFLLAIQPECPLSYHYLCVSFYIVSPFCWICRSFPTDS